ncbi:hypothetical protein EDB85DRAFT_1892948 [Lactarius pseudohatsudake]|nr:hypothetical protein EDB85DRAFT_1892948 [Lactarius pseudohatsudake]
MAAIVSHALRHRTLQTFYPDLAFLTACPRSVSNEVISAQPSIANSEACLGRRDIYTSMIRHRVLGEIGDVVQRLSGKKKRVGLERRVKIVHYGARSMGKEMVCGTYQSVII